MKKIPSVVTRMARSKNFSLPALRYNGPDHPNAVKELRAMLRVVKAAQNKCSDARSIDTFYSDEAELRASVHALERVRGKQS